MPCLCPGTRDWTRQLTPPPAPGPTLKTQSSRASGSQSCLQKSRTRLVCCEQRPGSQPASTPAHIKVGARSRLRPPGDSRLTVCASHPPPLQTWRPYLGLIPTTLKPAHSWVALSIPARCAPAVAHAVLPRRLSGRTHFFLRHFFAERPAGAPPWDVFDRGVAGDCQIPAQAGPQDPASPSPRSLADCEPAPVPQDRPPLWCVLAFAVCASRAGAVGLTGLRCTDKEHAQQSADILTRIITDSVFATHVKTLRVFVPGRDTFPMTFQTGACASARYLVNSR